MEANGYLFLPKYDAVFADISIGFYHRSKSRSMFDLVW